MLVRTDRNCVILDEILQSYTNRNWLYTFLTDTYVFPTRIAHGQLIGRCDMKIRIENYLSIIRNW